MGMAFFLGENMYLKNDIINSLSALSANIALVDEAIAKWPIDGVDMSHPEIKSLDDSISILKENILYSQAISGVVLSKIADLDMDEIYNVDEEIELLKEVSAYMMNVRGALLTLVSV